MGDGDRDGATGGTAAVFCRRGAGVVLRVAVVAAAIFAARNSLKLRQLDPDGGAVAAYFRQQADETEDLVRMLKPHSADSTAVGVWWRPEQRNPAMMDTVSARLNYDLYPCIVYVNEEEFTSCEWVVHRRDDRQAFVVMLRERGWAGKLEKVARTDEWLLLRWRGDERAELMEPRGARGAPHVTPYHAEPLPPAGDGSPSPGPTDHKGESAIADTVLRLDGLALVPEYSFARGMPPEPVLVFPVRSAVREYLWRDETAPLAGGPDVF